MNRVHVALDTNPLYVTAAGTARYVSGLLRTIPAISPDICIHPLAWQVHNLGYSQPTRAMKTLFREKFWTPFVAPRRLARYEAEILHVTSPLMFSPSTVRHTIATIYDLAPVDCPWRFRPWHLRAARQHLRRLAQMDLCICISRFTADRAINVLGLPANQIEIVYPGREQLPSPDLHSPPMAHFPENFFLFVGSLEPGKNLALLRAVYELAEARAMTLPSLLIVGARWKGVRGEGGPPKEWHYLGHQPDEVLSYLYSKALALVFPSLYEGFGLPVLEAMSCKCPVICSPIASLPEVAGDAALYAEQNSKSYLEAMQRIANSTDLRDHLIAKGIQQAVKFEWHVTGERVSDIYRSLA